MVQDNQLTVIRVDAARIMGTGHVMRCLALATAMRAQRMTVVFICRPHDGHLCALIEAQGFKVVRLEAPRVAPEYPEGRGYESWLGAPRDEDARETAAAIHRLGGPVKWLIVDHYGADRAWEEMVGASAERTLAIDDLGRAHKCDMILDQNVLDTAPVAGGAAAGAIALLGPHYALLAEAYAALHPRIPERRGRAKRLFVFLGDAGPVNITGKILWAVIAAKVDGIAVDVAVSRNSPHFAELQSLAEEQNNVTLHYGLPTLAPLMARADVAIGAGGSNSWERLCLGLPTAIVTVADNQKSIAEGLHRHKLARYVGHYDTYNESELAERFGAFLAGDIDGAWSLRCREAVDGRGAQRVSTLMMLGEETGVSARYATLADAAFVRQMLRGAFDEGFSASLRDIEGQRIFIVETGEAIALGYMHFARTDAAWTLTYALHPACAAPAFRAKLLATAFAELRRSETEDVALISIAAAENDGLPTPQVRSKNKRINICSDRTSWINSWVADLALQWINDGHRITWSHDARRLPPADFGFYLSYGRIVDRATLDKSAHNLVVHESDLPKGRGWSPLSWQILEGRNRVTATLFEAAESVDSGVIYRQEEMTFDGSELVDELRREQARATLSLCRAFVTDFPQSAGEARQQHGEPTFYPKRTPIDSRLDPAKTLGEQFNQLRIADNARYPAFFEIGQHRYYLRIDKA